MWIWNPTRQKAAVLVAADQIADREIAQRCGIARRTLQEWKLKPEFRGEVDRLLTPWRTRVLEDGIADRDRRVFRLNDRWRRMQAVIEQRGKEPGMQDVPGGKTGLLVRTYKSLGSGLMAQVVEEYEVDAGLLRELRAHEEQAARELGQWDENKVAPSQVILVIPRAVAPAGKPAIEMLPEPPPREVLGVTIDLR